MPVDDIERIAKELSVEPSVLLKGSQSRTVIHAMSARERCAASLSAAATTGLRPVTGLIWLHLAFAPEPTQQAEVVPTRRTWTGDE